MTLNDIIEAFNENKTSLITASEADNSDFKFNFNKCIDIINKFRSFKATFTDKKALVITNGNPYITLILCMQAISQNVNLTINIQNVMNSLNSSIVKIFEANLYENSPKLYREMTDEDVVEFNSDEIIVVDDKTQFNRLYEMGIKARFTSLLNIDLYTDSDNLSELTNTIYDYCNHKFIGIDVHKNQSIDDFINESNSYNSGNISLILTEKSLDKDDIYDKLNGKRVYINCNPFAKIEADIALKNIL